MAVSFNKPVSLIDTANDLDGNVCNFFKVQRDCANELIAALQLPPVDRPEYEDC
jgi:hypothetical protein